MDFGGHFLVWILGQVDDNNVRKSMLDLGLLEKASSNQFASLGDPQDEKM